MSYDIYIGQRLPGCPCGNSDECDQWHLDYVSEVTLPEAPDDTLSPMSAHNNGRHPGYSQWYNFTVEAGIHDLIGQSGTPLMPDHPGIATLTEDHYNVIKTAQERHAGGDEGITTRLNWLAWWMRWALDNCEWPAVFNS